jgi:hypothetical protein
MYILSNIKVLIVAGLPIIGILTSCKVNKEAPIPASDLEYAARVETIKPIVVADLSSCYPLTFQSATNVTSEFTTFEGIPDRDGQADLQVAVGGGYVVHATNSGISVFDKSGKLLAATAQSCLNDGIDPKLFYNVHNKIFAIDYWHYYDEPKKKPLNISVSATTDPTKTWNTYSISLTTAVDGGALGYSNKWMGYTYPKDDGGGTLVLLTDDAKQGKNTKIYHFDRAFGQPAFGQDASDDLYFLDVDDVNFTLNKVAADAQNVPYITKVWQRAHELKYNDYPPASPQKGTKSMVSSGDRNPKNLVLQGGYLWFSQTINYEGHSAVQWHQIDLNTGETVQSGIIQKDNSNYIQSTIAVNSALDVLVGFQETNANMYVSPCYTFRKSDDPNNTMRAVVTVEQGAGNYGDGSDKVSPWGDYSGSIIDGDNLKDLWTNQGIMLKSKVVGNRIVKVKF